MQASFEQSSPKQFDSQARPIAIFKLIVIGDSGIGKSTFIHQFSTGILEELVINDQKITVHKTRFPTSIGDIQFNIWDLDGASVETESSEEFFAGADCAILMFDTTSRISYKDVPFWYKKIHSMNEHQTVPIVLVGNKVEIRDRKVKFKQIQFHRKKNISYYDVSAKANYEIEKPFIHLLRALTKNMSLNLVGSSIVQPSSLTIDEDLARSLETQRLEAESLVIPDDDDDY